MRRVGGLRPPRPGEVLSTGPAGAKLDVTFLLPLAAGNFIYVAASDLIPEVNRPRDLRHGALHLAFFLAGALALHLLAVREH
jgi:zinc transporter ZupT